MSGVCFIKDIFRQSITFIFIPFLFLVLLLFTVTRPGLCPNHWSQTLNINLNSVSTKCKITQGLRWQICGMWSIYTSLVHEYG